MPSCDTYSQPLKKIIICLLSANRYFFAVCPSEKIEDCKDKCTGPEKTCVRILEQDDEGKRTFIADQCRCYIDTFETSKLQQ